MPREERKRKRQRQSIQSPEQGREHLPGPSKETPKSSAKSIEKTKRENLTLFDWMTVYTYVDTLPQPINQGKVVKYFATRPEGALLFTQSTLSRKLRHRSEMEARVDSSPNALSRKRPRIERRRITGQPSTLDELSDPKEEREIGECLDSSEGGDLEIVEMVQAEVGLASGDIEEIDSDSDDDEPEVVPLSLKKMIEACRMVEENCMVVCTEGSLELVQALRRYRGHLLRLSRESAKQTTLDVL